MSGDSANPEPHRTGTYELLRGSVVGKYEILRKIATGGMAEIYLARATGHAGFEKLVVLKRILPGVAEDPTFVQMFLDEAKLAATLRHPNIADVYDVGESDGAYFFTMEFVHGQDVRTIRYDAQKRNENVPLAISLAIIHGAASALDHAHEKTGPDGQLLGLVHRDVSSSNVMVSYDGAVKLLDFGIARATTSSHKTQTGTLKGKVPYMSPEQCRGLPVDRRSDLFSLGVVFYELTVGCRPFRGDSDFAIMDQIVYQGATPPSQLVHNYPAPLEALVMRLLERGPSQRYATAEELLHDIDAFVANHGLWLSSRAIGKYMRELFTDRIEAWEQAQQEGVPFAQHVAHTITSQSQRSEIVTPPSQFPALEPGIVSDRMRAASPSQPVVRLSEPMAVFQPMRPGATSQAMAAVRAERISYPVLDQRSSLRWIGLAFVATLIAGAGGVAGFMLLRKPAAEPAPMTGGHVEMIETSAKPAQSVPAERLTAPIADTKPTVAETPPTVPTKPETKPAEPKRVAAEPRAKPAKRPATQRPKAEIKKAEPTAEPKPEPKEAWDPNSPTLPH